MRHTVCQMFQQVTYVLHSYDEPREHFQFSCGLVNGQVYCMINVLVKYQLCRHATELQKFHKWRSDCKYGSRMLIMIFCVAYHNVYDALQKCLNSNFNNSMCNNQCVVMYQLTHCCDNAIYANSQICSLIDAMLSVIVQCLI